MSSFNISFPTDGDFTGGSSYRLIELSPELVRLFESEDLSPGSLTIKGRRNDDAVFCTPSSTYAIKSIAVSNTVAVVTSPSQTSPKKQFVPSTPIGNVPSVGEHDLVIRDQLHEYLELVPIVPRLEQLDSLLRGTVYEGEELGSQDGGSARPAKRRRITYEQVKCLVQASQQELDDGLKKARVISVDGLLQTLTLQQLSDFLQKALNTMVSEGLPANRVDLNILRLALLREHDISEQLTDQVIQWFGSTDGDYWEPDVDDMSKMIGLALLNKHKTEPVKEGDFMEQWRSALGDTFEDRVNLSLLTRNYLSSESDPMSATATRTLLYFPSLDLPTLPAERFRDLFLTRQKWRADAIIPFIDEITVDSKMRDKLLLKFCRTITDDAGQVWYTGRGNY